MKPIRLTVLLAVSASLTVARVFADEVPKQADQHEDDTVASQLSPLERWYKEETRVQGELEQLIQQLNADNYFRREQAQRDIVIVLTSVGSTINPLPASVCQVISPRRQGISPEQKARLASVRKKLEQLEAESPTRVVIDAQTTSGTVLRDVAALTGVTIILEEPLQDVSCQLDTAKNTYLQVLKQVCQQTSTYPTLQHNLQELILQRQGCATDFVIDSTGYFMGIFFWREGKTEPALDVQLHCDPKKLLVALLHAEAGYGGQVVIQPRVTPHWDFNQKSLPQPTRSTSITVRPASSAASSEPKEDSMSVKAVLAEEPREFILPLEGFNNVEVGEQILSAVWDDAVGLVHVYIMLPADNSYEDPFCEHKIAIAANQYQLLDGQGGRVPTKVTRFTLETAAIRYFVVDLCAPTQPAVLRVQAFTSIDRSATVLLPVPDWNGR